jgi:hypothetical protein
MQRCLQIKPNGLWFSYSGVCKSNQNMGFGLVIRHHNGNFLVGYGQGLHGITEPEVAEAIAFRHAVHFVLALPYKNVIAACDYPPVVKKLHSKKKDCSQVVVLIQDIKQAAKGSITFSLHTC